MSRLTSCYFLRFPVYPLHERQRNVAICVRVQVSSGAKRPSPTPLVTPAPTAQRTASAYHAPARTSENAAVQTASVRCGSSTREQVDRFAALREVREAAVGIARADAQHALVPARVVHRVGAVRPVLPALATTSAPREAT